MAIVTNKKEAKIEGRNVDACKRDIARLMLKWIVRGRTAVECEKACKEMAESMEDLFDDAAAAARFNKITGKGGGRRNADKDED